MVQAQTKYDLPKNAQIIETRALTPNKALILWMIDPKKNPREASDDIYTCPDYTRGSYYRGKTRVSLVNTNTQKIINTIEVIKDDVDSFDIPYLIERHYYKVPVINSKKEGKPEIMAFQDFNDDGKAQEFVLYDALACMGLDTTLIGYSQKQDKVIQYPVELKIDDRSENLFWVDYFFSHKPTRKSFWQYQIDYRGRGGSLDKYEISYDQADESFKGKITSTTEDND